MTVRNNLVFFFFTLLSSVQKRENPFDDQHSLKKQDCQLEDAEKDPGLTQRGGECKCLLCHVISGVNVTFFHVNLSNIQGFLSSVWSELTKIHQELSQGQVSEPEFISQSIDLERKTFQCANLNCMTPKQLIRAQSMKLCENRHS